MTSSQLLRKYNCEMRALGQHSTTREGWPAAPQFEDLIPQTRAIEFAEPDRQTAATVIPTLDKMAASAAVRCLRVMPSMVYISRISTPSAKAVVAGALLRRNSLQGGLPEPDRAKCDSPLDSLASLPRSVDGVEVNSAGLSAAGFGSPPAVMTTMEAVNRNARRPKKANHGKRPCSHVGRRQRRRRKNIIKNGP